MPSGVGLQRYAGPTGVAARCPCRAPSLLTGRRDSCQFHRPWALVPCWRQGWGQRQGRRVHVSARVEKTDAAKTLRLVGTGKAQSSTSAASDPCALGERPCRCKKILKTRVFSSKDGERYWHEDVSTRHTNTYTHRHRRRHYRLIDTAACYKAAELSGALQRSPFLARRVLGSHRPLYMSMKVLRVSALCTPVYTDCGQARGDPVCEPVHTVWAS